MGKTAFPEGFGNWPYSSKVAWILSRYRNNEKQDADGYAMLREDAPDDVKKVYKELIDIKKKAWEEKGIIID